MAVSLLRKARKAVFAEDYELGRDLYAEAMAQPDHQANLDLRMRYGWCAQKCGDVEEAVRVYQQVQEQYLQMGEPAAAESLTLMIAALPKQNEATSDAIQHEEDAGSQPLSEVEMTEALCGMGQIRQLRPQDLLCKVGDTPDSLWLLQYGTLRIELPEYDEPDYLHAEDRSVMLVGEIGVFTRQRRLATLIAENELGVVEIPSADIYQRCIHDKPFAEGFENLARERWVMPVLSQHIIFNRINDIDRRRLVDAFELEYCEPGHVLVEAGCEYDGCFMLQTGCLFYMHSEDGDPCDHFESDTGELVISVLPGDIVHMGGLLQGFSSPYRIVCATPVQVLHLKRQHFEPFAMRRPWIMPAILKFSEKPARLQIMRPADDYLWSADRKLVFSDSHPQGGE